VVSSTPRPHFTPGKDPVPILQETGWAPGPVWTGGKSRPTGIRPRTVQPVAQSLYRLSYPAHGSYYIHTYLKICYSAKQAGPRISKGPTLRNMKAAALIPPRIRKTMMCEPANAEGLLHQHFNECIP